MENALENTESKLSLDSIISGAEYDSSGMSGGDVDEAEADSEVEEGSEKEPATTEESSEVEEAGPTPGQSEDSKSIPLPALLDERDKRQAAEKQLKEMQAKLDALTAKKDEPRPDVFEDQEGAFAHLESRIELARLQDRMDMSREFMSMVKDDYEAREQQFLALAQDDDSLIAKLKSSANPAKFAYETAVKAERVKQMENVDEYKAKLEAEIRAKVLKEFEEQGAQSNQKQEAKRNSVTPSLAKTRNVSGESAKSGDVFNELFG